MMKQYRSGAVIRGRYIEENLVSFGGRSAGVEFMAPDPHALVDRLPLDSPTKLGDLYSISFDEILDYLDELGQRLRLETNPFLQEALETAAITASVPRSLVASGYRSVAPVFARDTVREVAEKRIGIEYLDGWKPMQLLDGRTLSVRAFGARALHIIAGNSPVVAAMSFMRNAITRSDMIVKSPSNDPFTALAIARTMIQMAPDHPLTKHVSVAYWKGGDEAIERKLYQPQCIEKLVAWGGLASVKHVTKYIQPGLELISLDPKRSASIIGPECFDSEAVQKHVALRLATDMGAFNQEGCVNARVVYVLSGTDAAGLARLNRFGQHVYDALMKLPDTISTKPKQVDYELKANINSASLNDDWYHVIGGDEDEGAIIVSQTSQPVDFAVQLANRTANLVPIDNVEEVFQAVNAYTQTVGIYPESLKTQLRDRLPLYGAQRLTSLGYAAVTSMAGPWDAIEPERRMCKWIIDEQCDPAKVNPLWESGLIINSSAKCAA
jgi:Acyl-CoA reductase (LuxC)